MPPRLQLLSTAKAGPGEATEEHMTVGKVYECRGVREGVGRARRGTGIGMCLMEEAGLWGR